MAISGTYIIGANTPMGRMEGRMVLIDEGGAFRGTVTAMGDVVEFQDVRTDGDSFEFDVNVQSPMGPMDVTVKAVVDGDKISGEFVTSVGSLAFDGVRTGG